jgi:hypothetical protein
VCTRKNLAGVVLLRDTECRRTQAILHHNGEHHSPCESTLHLHFLFSLVKLLFRMYVQGLGGGGDADARSDTCIQKK